jgi:hypothetical protein
MVERLQMHAGDVRRLTSGLDAASLDRPSAPDKWSLKKIVCHLWRVQDVFEKRIEAMLAHDAAAVEAYNPEGDAQFNLLAALPAAEVPRGFLSARDYFVSRLYAITPEQWQRTGRHPEYPGYGIAFQVEYMVHHEAHHLYQIYQRRAAFGPVPR